MLSASDRVKSPLATSSSVDSRDRYLTQKTYPSFLNFLAFPPSFISSIEKSILPDFTQASIFHDSSGTNALISRSRSTRIFTATDWTRPAESPERTLRQRTGDTSYHTMRSRIRRDCWAFTRSIYILRGWAIACSIAVFVIS